MARGDGSIIQRGKGVWEVQVSFGKNESGKYDKVSRVVRGTKKDAIRVRDELKASRDVGVKAYGSKTLLSEVAQDWLEIRKIDESIGESSKLLDALCISILLEQFKGERIGDITPLEIEQFYRGLANGSLSRSGNPLKGNSLIKYHYRLKMIFQRAVDHNLLYKNPCDRVKPPTCNKAERKSLTAEESAILLCAINQRLEEAYLRYEEKELRWEHVESRTSLNEIIDIARIIAIRIALETGMRRGEVLALVWEDVNLPRNEIHVRHSLDVKGHIKSTKTIGSIRTVSVNDGVVQALSEWKSFQMKEKAKFPTQLPEAKTPVVCNSLGGFTNPANFSKWWIEWRKENGFDDLGFHELRHTQASLLLSNGVDIKTVQARLGHSSPLTTLSLYAHVQPGWDRKASDLFGSIVSGERLGA